MNRFPLKWHGGKSYLAKHIIGLIPEHIHYVEPYFGGGAVLFSKPPELVDNHSEVVNDIDGRLINFWKVMKNDFRFRKFKRLIEGVPFSSREFHKSKSGTLGLDFQEAADFFIQYRQSRQGLGKDFATLSKTRTRRGMNEQVSSWLSAIEGLPEAHDRLKRVVIYEERALNVINREDSKDTFFYCDPPYLHSTRVSKRDYKYEMSWNDHENLLKLLANIEGKFVLSGYRSYLYEVYAEKHNWNCKRVKIDNKASSQKTKPIKTECMWYNYEL